LNNALERHAQRQANEVSVLPALSSNKDIRNFVHLTDNVRDFPDKNSPQRQPGPLRKSIRHAVDKPLALPGQGLDLFLSAASDADNYV